MTNKQQPIQPTTANAWRLAIYNAIGTDDRAIFTKQLDGQSADIQHEICELWQARLNACMMFQQAQEQKQSTEDVVRFGQRVVATGEAVLNWNPERKTTCEHGMPEHLCLLCRDERWRKELA